MTESRGARTGRIIPDRGGRPRYLRCRERDRPRVLRDQRVRELLLARDDLASVPLELGLLGAFGAQALALLHEVGERSLERVDVGRVRHDLTYDARRRTLAARMRKKCVKKRAVPET